MDHLAAARRAAAGDLGLELLEPAAGAAAAKAERRPVTEHLAALLAQPVGRLPHGRQPSAARHGQRVRVRTECRSRAWPSRAARFRKRRSGASTARISSASTATCSLTRGVEERGHILYRQGKIPGSFYTGRGNEASAVAVATAMGRDDVGTPLHRDMGVHIMRGVEPWRIFANYMGRADGPAQGQGRKRPHGRPPPRADRDGLATCRRCCRSRSAARSPSGSGRSGASRSAWFGEGSPRARRRARGDELRRRPPAARRLHLRQQPVGLLDADPPRVRGRAPRRPRRRLRLRGRRRRRHRRARRLPRGEARDREGAPGRRPDADRERHAPDGGPRGPRRRLLRPEASCSSAGPSATRSSATAAGCATTPTSPTRRRTRSRTRSRSI